MPRLRNLQQSPARRWVMLGCALLIGLGLGMAYATVQADSYDERRMRTAARLVRALLAADTGVATKAGADGWLEVVLLGEAGSDADDLAGLIAPVADDDGPSRVRGMPLRVREVSRLTDVDGARPMAVFLARPLPDSEFRRVLDWCIGEGVILYSPFEGDVERGATAGLSVQAKVQPFLNRRTLDSSRIELQAFFIAHSRTVP